MKYTIIALLISLCHIIHAQEKIAEQNSKSKIETQFLTKGKLIKKEFIPLGVIQSKYTSIDVAILKLEDLTTGVKIFGVKVSFEASSSYSSSTKSAFIDRDEINDVIITLKKMNENIINTTPSNYTEVIYVCRSGYEIGVYYDKSKKWVAYMKLEEYDSNSDLFLETDALLTFQILLQQAQTKFE